MRTTPFMRKLIPLLCVENRRTFEVNTNWSLHLELWNDHDSSRCSLKDALPSGLLRGFHPKWSPVTTFAALQTPLGPTLQIQISGRFDWRGCVISYPRYA